MVRKALKLIGVLTGATLIAAAWAAVPGSPRPSEPASRPPEARGAHAPRPGSTRLIYIVNTNLSPGTEGSALRIATAVRRVSGLRTVIEHHSRATSARIREIRPVGIILSGQGNPWDDYSPAALQGVMKMIRQAPCPVLGICGGHQLVALTFGGKVDRIRRSRPGRGYEGCWKESGYRRIRVVASDPVVGAAGTDLLVLESHYDEVKGLPPLLKLVAVGSVCRVQAMKHEKRPIYGVQFHPERWDQKHAAGREVLQRFLQLCAVSANQLREPN